MPHAKHSNRWAWGLLIGANVLAWAMLGGQRDTVAQQPQPQRGNLPFANSLEQRGEMVQVLREIQGELKAQNELLRSGKLTVIIADKK